MVDLSLILMCWNTSHLLDRTLFTLQQQTINNWELLIIDDNSEDDVPAILEKHSSLPIRYFRLEHAMGMRGNTVSLNYGIRKARGRVVAWSTPEVMIPPGALESMFNVLINTYGLTWVTIPSHGIAADMQLKIDTVNWKEDIHNLKQLVADLPEEDWNSIWFNINFYEDGRPSQRKKTAYGHNQTVAVMRDKWQEKIERFPYYCDYGSDDPMISDKRKKKGYIDVALWDQEGYHQWHPNTQYWMAQDKAPYWNRGGHTIDNLLGDPLVPAGGTRMIWDGGSKEKLSDTESKAIYRQWQPIVEATGFKPR